MVLVATVFALTAATVLVIAGYVLGVIRGERAREKLRRQSLQGAMELQQANQRLAEVHVDDAGRPGGKDFNKLLEAVLRHDEATERMLEILARRDAEVESLRAVVQQGLTPLTQRERLALELSSFQSTTGHHRDNLARLLDQVAEKGQFGTVLLTDEAGLPLAVSSNARDLERLSAISSLVLLVADRLARDDAPAPLSLMMHDEANKLTLCRIFRVGGQRLLLMGVSRGAQLTPTALDPALEKVDTVLST